MMAGRKGRAAVVAVVMITGCGANKGGQGPGGEGVATSGGGTAGSGAGGSAVGAGSSSTGGAGGVAAPASVRELICSDVTLELPPKVQPIFSEAVFPVESAVGGEIQPGVYELASWTVYGDSVIGADAWRQAIFAVDDSGFAGFHVVTSTGTTLRLAGEFSVVGDTQQFLEFRYECPDEVAGTVEGTSFAVSGTAILLFEEQSVLRYERKP